MSLTTFFQKVFGTKSERDLRVIKKPLAAVLEAYKTIDKLSDDELRAKTQELKQRIADYKAPQEARVAEIDELLKGAEISIKEKSKLADEKDALIKEIDRKIEEALIMVLPEAFAVVKSTARRLAENPEITVTATDFDKKLAAEGRDFVRIEGDKAIWKNHWIAGGNEITWDMVHFDVQLIGGIVLTGAEVRYKDDKFISNIAEMATGEGKTLVATLPVFLNALAGKGVHVVTVNDYLAKRDSEWMGPLYMFHGLSVDCIDKYDANGQKAERRRAYACDITYGTNSEFGFDYLRDNMVGKPEDIVQRKHHYALIDEADSILIDDARTPLIISGVVPQESDKQFDEYKPFVQKLYAQHRTEVNTIFNEAKRLIAAGDTGYAWDETSKKEQTPGGGLLLLRAFKGLPNYGPLVKFLSEPGMKQLLQNAENFFIQDNSKQMHVVTDALLCVIDEKQRTVELTDRGFDFLSGCAQDDAFFVIPQVGERTAEIENDETLSLEDKVQAKDALSTEFSLKTERIHTVTQLLKAFTLFTKDVDYVVIDGNVKIVDEQTGRIMEGRRYSDGLHQAIEAKENVEVAAASQTVATITLQNYFRMYHKLAGMTGTAETEAGEFWEIYKLDVIVIPTNKPIARQDLDDKIYKTRKAKFDAIVARVRELTAEGRPVLIGTKDVDTSELLSRRLTMLHIPHQVLNAKQHAREAEVVRHAGESGMVTIATNMAGRGTDIKLTPEVKAAGGLAIIGSERHDSRRVDRQLRGRSGRQGDPGSSEFYISLQDDLMRIFGAERIAKVVDSLGMEEDEALVSPMLSKSVERAQKKVEENHFGIRKRTLEYDDIMNKQREVAYSRRRDAIYGDRVEITILNMMQELAYDIVDKAGDYNYEAYNEYLLGTLSLECSLTPEEYARANSQRKKDALYQNILSTYERRMKAMIDRVNPVIKPVYEKQGALYENIAVPVTDGKTQMTLGVNLKNAYENDGAEIAKSLCKTLILWRLDHHWQAHLRDMDDLRQNVQNAVYEQKDPLVIYKQEGFNLFYDRMLELDLEVVSFLLRAKIALSDPDKVQEKQAETRRRAMSSVQTSRQDLMTNGSEPKSNMPVRVEKTVGRNDPCPCGSGKKYKNCHGAGKV